MCVIHTETCDMHLLAGGSNVFFEWRQSVGMSAMKYTWLGGRAGSGSLANLEQGRDGLGMDPEHMDSAGVGSD